MSKPNLSKLAQLFEKEEEFTLSRKKYISLTGADIPQDASYTKSKSAVAKLAKEYGYEIEVIPETLVFKKVNN